MVVVDRAPADEPRVSPISEDAELDRSALERDGLFRVCRGHREAVALLADARLHANFVRVFEWLGVSEGPLWRAAAASLLSVDGERHHRARAALAPAFTPRAVERARPFHRATAERLADAVASGGTFDVVHDFAGPYIAAGTCDYVGFDADEVSGLADALYRIAVATKDLAARIELFASGLAEFVAFAERAIERRRAEPADDIVGRVVAAIDRQEIDEEVAAVMLAALLSAGHEPTINQVGLMVAALAEAPELWDQVAADAMLAPRVVEEVLRHRGTNQGTLREVAEPFSFGGADLRRGETIFISIADANHDPRRFPHPDRLDPEANRGGHLAFGVGAHYCLGASLARLQLQEALIALSARMGPPSVLERVDFEGGGLVGSRILRVACEARPRTTAADRVP